MTRYTVVWVQEAQDELGYVWLRASDHQAVTDAAQVVARELAEDATVKGIDLHEGLRAFFAPPLRVMYAVNEQDRLVEVLRVMRI